MPLIKPKTTRWRQIVILGHPEENKWSFVHTFVYGIPLPGQPIDSFHTGRLFNIDGIEWPLGFENIANLDPALLLGAYIPNASPDITEYVVKGADGIILMYDITSMESFDYVTKKAYKYICQARTTKAGASSEYAPAPQRVGCVLVGCTPEAKSFNFNRKICYLDNREVSMELAKNWADSQGFQFFELGCMARGMVEDVFRALIKSIIWSEQRNREDAEAEKKKLNKKPFDVITRGRHPEGNKLRKRPT